MSSTFLFGAGASAFSGECYPTTPPLGADLFSELRRRGGVAAEVEEDLVDLFGDFEAGMAEFRRRHEVKTSALLRDMARYFAEFRPGDSNQYRRHAKIRRWF